MTDKEKRELAPRVVDVVAVMAAAWGGGQLVLGRGFLQKVLGFGAVLGGMELWRRNSVAAKMPVTR